jgi:hypothetical protein
MEQLIDFFELQSFRSDLKNDWLSKWEQKIHDNIFTLTQWSGLVKSYSSIAKGSSEEEAYLVAKGWPEEEIYLADEIVSDIVLCFYAMLRTGDAKKMRIAVDFIETAAANLKNLGPFQGEYETAVINLINIKNLSE